MVSTTSVTPVLQMGRIVATPGAIEAMDAADCHPFDMLHRHVCGDWGDVCVEDGKSNDEALQVGSRVISAYTFGGTKFWVITEAEDDNGHRAATTILLPSEY